MYFNDDIKVQTSSSKIINSSGSIFDEEQVKFLDDSLYSFSNFLTFIIVLEIILPKWTP